jgi:hypothetical protein
MESNPSYESSFDIMLYNHWFFFLGIVFLEAGLRILFIL